MARVHPPPIDILQGMINGILIETGRALRSADKEGGRTLAAGNLRLRNTIPSAADNFHQALDELEYEIVSAKAVFLRDLEELRSKRLALENPVSAEEAQMDLDTNSTANETNENVGGTEDTMISSIINQTKVEIASESPRNGQANTTEDIRDPDQPPADDTVKHTGSQGPTPPSSITDAPTNSKPIGLGIDTNGIEEDATAPNSAGAPNSAIDSLFDGPESEHNAEDGDLTFDDLNVSHDDTTTNTQSHEQAPSEPQTQTQANDLQLDLSTFGETSQDINMDNNITTDNNNAANLTDPSATELFEPDNNADDNLDIDMDLGVQDSVFEDMYFMATEDSNMGGGDEMQHGEYDNAFFGL